MFEFIVSNQELGLCSFSASWPSKKEENVRFGQKTKSFSIVLILEGGTWEELQPIERFYL